jgi:hypothetical protein
MPQGFHSCPITFIGAGAFLITITELEITHTPTLPPAGLPEAVPW